MAITLGTAYLDVQPSTDGLVPALRKGFGGVEREAEKAGDRSGKRFADGAGKGSGGVKGLIGKLGIIGLGLQAGEMFVGEFSKGIKGAADLEQSKGAIQAVFGEDSKVIDGQARKAAKSLGLSRNAYNELASTVGAGLKNKGIDDYAGSTQQLLGLGADLAAQFGGDTKTAVEAISSLMRGESDPIERYGVSINETAVAAELAARGQKDLTGAALESAKAQARLDILMRQTTDAQGAFGREADTVAGKQQRAGAQWEDVRTKIGEKFLPVVQAVAGFFSDKLIPGIDSMVSAWQSGQGPIGTLQTVFQGIYGVIRDKVMPVLGGVGKFIAEKVAPTFRDFGERVVGPIFNNVILPALSKFWDFLKNYVGPAISWLWENIFQPAFSGMGDAVDTLGRTWGSVWGQMQRAAAAPVNFVIGTVWNDGLRKVINLVREAFGGSALPPLELVSWGSTSGRGSAGGKGAARAFHGGGYTGHGGKYDPAGIVHRGEYVLTKEEVAHAGGPSGVERWKDTLPGYALGGAVGTGFGSSGSDRALTTFNGKTFTRLFAASLAMAQRLAGAKFQISQGGFRPRTSYSGTSHQGDAVDITSPITNAVIAALRSAGIAAWDRTGKGNWRPHIHGVPLPGRGYAGGSAIAQAQSYLRGGDGLGGRDNGPRVNVGGSLSSVRNGDGLAEIPRILGEVISNLGTLTGPWGERLRDGFTGLVDDARNWAAARLDDLGDGFSDFFLGYHTEARFSRGARALPTRGYANGTPYAAPGLAWVGERGPELVRFSGGQRVYTAEQSAVMGGGTTIQHLTIEARLEDIDDIAKLGALIRDARRVNYQGVG